MEHWGWFWGTSPFHLIRKLYLLHCPGMHLRLGVLELLDLPCEEPQVDHGVLGSTSVCWWASANPRCDETGEQGQEEGWEQGQAWRRTDAGEWWRRWSANWPTQDHLHTHGDWGDGQAWTSLQEGCQCRWSDQTPRQTDGFQKACPKEGAFW